jgi:hypothetical protein
MKRFTLLVLGALVAAGLTGGSASAQDSLTVAQFSQRIPGNTEFFFDNDGAMLTSTSVVPIRFTFADSPFLLDGSLANELATADLIMDYESSDAAVANGGTSYTQTSSTLSSIQVVATASAGNTALGIGVGDVLFEVHYGSSRLDVSGASGTLAASQPDDAVDFLNTAYFDFSNANLQALALAFSGVSPAFDSSNGIAGNGLLRDFVASGAGTFSAAVVPEPASLAMAGLGALGVLGLAVVRRRKSN